MATVVLWPRTSTFTAISSPIIGLLSGVTSWLVATKLRSGEITIVTTGNFFNSLTGDCVSSSMGALTVIALSYLVPNKSPIIDGEELGGV
jgi:hypothetical protein